MSKSKQNLGESSFILVISTILVKIVSAFFKVPLANDNFLGDLGFGYFSIAHDFFMPFYVLAISGLPVAVSHMTAEFIAKKQFSDAKKNFYATRKLFVILGFVFTVLISLISIPIVIKTESQNATLYSILAITPSIFLCFLLSVYRGYFEGFCNMVPSAVSRLIEAIAKLVFGLLLSFLVIKRTGDPVFASAAAISSITIGTLISTLYLHINFKKRKNTRYILNTNENNTKLSAILILAVPFALSSLASSFISLIDVISVKLLIAEDISTYLYSIRSKAFTLYNFVPTITMSLGVGALPILTEDITKNDDISFKKNLNQLLKTTTIITMPAGFGILVISNNIMDLLYSSTTSLGNDLLRIYGIATIFTGISIPFITILQSMNFSYKALKHIIIGVLLKVVINIILISIPTINIYGSAIGTVICYFYIFTSLFFIILKHTHFDIKNCLIKPLFAAVVCVIPAFAFCTFTQNKLSVIIAISLSAITYLLMVCILKIFNREEALQFPLMKTIFKILKVKF